MWRAITVNTVSTKPQVRPLLFVGEPNTPQSAGEVRCISGFAAVVGHYSNAPCPREIIIINDALHVQEEIAASPAVVPLRVMSGVLPLEMLGSVKTSMIVRVACR